MPSFTRESGGTLHVAVMGVNRIGKGYSIGREGSIGELFQYMKEIWITIIFLYYGIKNINGLFIMWSLLFFYILADDSLPIRLTPMTATCRVPPLSRVKLGIGWSRGVARDAEQ